MKNIVVMISGNGSNLQQIIDAIEKGKINGKVVGVVSNKENAYGLERAKQVGISSFIFTRKNFDSNLAMDMAIADQIEQLKADVIILAGYMKILTPEFTQRFVGKIVNIHPSLLPKYPGLNTHQRAMEAGDTEHGMTIHFVNEKVDGGAIILQAKVPIYPEDNIDDVADRVIEQEHRCYPLVVKWLCAERLYFKDGYAYLDDQLLPEQGYALD
ncbi:phosphoribosylglycinamide formyltransferase [Pasteurellaceae bacterium 15-036681]|nr:phosphoribosylglycinamide formyltransferase [Pasteurellaceae bacterium 15-036681]